MTLTYETEQNGMTGFSHVGSAKNCLTLKIQPKGWTHQIGWSGVYFNLLEGAHFGFKLVVKMCILFRQCLLHLPADTHIAVHHSVLAGTAVSTDKTLWSNTSKLRRSG